MANEADSSTPTPTRDEKQYTKLLDQYLGPVSGMIILLLCLGVFKLPGPLSEQLAVDLSMNADEQEMIIPALASLLDKQKFPDHVKQAIMTSGSWIGLGLGIGMYSMRVWAVLGQVRRDYVAFTATQSTQTSSQNGHQGGGLPFGQFAAVENRGL